MEAEDEVPVGMIVPVLAGSLCSSILSLLGSSCILHMARRKLHKLHHRLLFALSISDIGTKISFVLSPYLLPPDSGFLHGVSYTSCTVMGFLFSCFTFMTTWYSAILSLYFLAVVRFNWKEQPLDTTSRKCAVLPVWEILMHLVVILLPIGIMMVAAMNQSIRPHPFFPICYIIRYPHGCVDAKEEDNEEIPMTNSSAITYSTDDEGGVEYYCHATDPMVHVVTRLVHFAFLSLGTLTALTATAVVFGTVRTTLRRSMQYQQPQGCDDDAVQRRIQQVGSQAILYCLAYVNSYIYPLVASVVNAATNGAMLHENRNNPGYYALILLAAWFLPLQGALNFFVYTRMPRNQWKQAAPDSSMIWRLKQVLAGKVAPGARRGSSGTRIQSSMTRRQSSRRQSLAALNASTTNKAEALEHDT